MEQSEYQRLLEEQRNKKHQALWQYRSKYGDPSFNEIGQLNSLNQLSSADVPDRSFDDFTSDVGTSLTRGVVQLGDAVIGLANIPTGGYAGKFLEDVTGYKSDELDASLTNQYSEAQKAANKRVAKAEGFLGTVGTALQNPSTIVHAALESVPSMVGGGLIGRGLLKAVPKLSYLAASAIGEGSVQAGSMAEAVRQQSDTGLITGSQTAKAIGSGIGTGIFGTVGGRVAKKFGVGNIDEWLVGKKVSSKASSRIANEIAESSVKNQKGVVNRIVGGGISEGIFEELPQSIQEQIWMNAATDKPLGEEVGEAGAMGMLAGAVMGGGFSIFTKPQVMQDEKDITPTSEISIEELHLKQREAQQRKEEALKKAKLNPEEQKIATEAQAEEAYWAAEKEAIMEQIFNRSLKNDYEGTLTRYVENPDLLKQLPDKVQKRFKTLLQENIPEGSRTNKLISSMLKRNQQAIEELTYTVDEPFEAVLNDFAELDPIEQEKLILREQQALSLIRKQQEITKNKEVGASKSLQEIEVEDALEKFASRIENHLPNFIEITGQQQKAEIPILEGTKPGQIISSVYQDSSPEAVPGSQERQSSEEQQDENLLAIKQEEDFPEMRSKSEQRESVVGQDVPSYYTSKTQELKQKYFPKVKTQPKNIQLIIDRKNVFDDLLAEVKEPKKRARLEQRLIDPLLGEYGVTPKADFDETLSELDAADTDYILEAVDGGNLGGVNSFHKDVHAKADADIKKVWGEVLTDTVRDFGGAVYRTGGDEFRIIWPGYTKEEVAEIRDDIEAQMWNKITELGLAKIGHPKHGNLPTGALYTSYGFSSSTDHRNPNTGKVNKGDMDREAELAQGEMSIAYIAQIAAAEGKQYNPETKVWEDSDELRTLEQESRITEERGYTSPGEVSGQSGQTEIASNPPTETVTQTDSETGTGIAPANLEVTPEEQIDRLSRSNVDQQKIITPTKKEIKSKIAANNAEIDILWDERRSTQDKEKKNDLFLKIQELIVANQHMKAGTDGRAQFEVRENKTPGQGMQLSDIQTIYPGQDVFQSDAGRVSVRFKNGKSVTFQNIQDAGSGYIHFAVSTGQMSKDGKILGVTIDNEVLLDRDFADKFTLWHENKHVLDNLNMITEADNSVLTQEYNKLRQTDQLDFAPSTHEDPVQAMRENLANTFAQVMTQREQYRETALGTMIQRVMDFFQKLFTFGQQSLSGLATEVESGQIYGRPEDQNTNNQTDLSQFQIIPVKEEHLPGPVKDILDLPYWKKIKDLKQLYRNEEFFQKTGFWLAGDGKWRYELDKKDVGFSPTKEIKELFSTYDSDNFAYTSIPLKQVLNSDKLFKIIPSLQEVKVRQGPAFEENLGTYRMEEKEILLGSLKPDLFYHELQHAINKELEAFYGGSPEAEQLLIKNKQVYDRLLLLSENITDLETKALFDDFIFDLENDIKENNLTDWEEFLVSELAPFLARQGEKKAFQMASFPFDASSIRSDAQQNYLNLSGEMEARLAVHRMQMESSKRRKIPPWKTLNQMLVSEGINPDDNILYPDKDIGVQNAKRYKTAGNASSVPMFQVSEPVPRTISDEEYARIHAKKKNLWDKIKQVARVNKADFRLFVDRAAGPISTRLKNVSPLLAAEVRNHDARILKNISDQLQVAYPIMKKVKGMSSSDKSMFDWATKNGAIDDIKSLAAKYDFEEDYQKLRVVLDKIHQDALDVGYDVGYIENYWPRILKDREGFLQATQGLSRDPIFSQALKKKADKLGVTVNSLDPDLKADIISNLILEGHSGISGPSNIQKRIFNVVPEEYSEFYVDSGAALMTYIYSMNKKIQARKFFGKAPKRIAAIKTKMRAKQTSLARYVELEALQISEGQDTSGLQTKIQEFQDDIKLYSQEIERYKHRPDFQENISTYILQKMADGTIKENDQQTVKEILNARFHERGTTGLVHKYKNAAYIDVMGNPFSALTQIGDLAWAYYVGGLTPTGIARTTKNVFKAAMKRSNITKEDLGIERIAQEFADADTLSNAVSWVFKKVGLEKMDSIGKETLINTAFENYKAQAIRNPEQLKKDIKHIFGKETDSVITDLVGNNPTDNVKLLTYHRLLDFQPVALSEMPEWYLNSGNGRIFYMLKTYTMKQIDIFRREVYQEMRAKDPQKRMQGFKNLLSLGFLLTFANAGADELKDFIAGKETRFKDHVIDNLMTMGGASRYMRMQVRREGAGSAFFGQLLPPFKFVDSISRDVFSSTEDGLRSIESIPLGGKLYYWRVGRGSENRPSIQEKDFKKLKKDVDKFRKKFESSDNKREFLQTNLDQFRQMKRVDNMQSILNKNKTLINKLKDMDQTTNVRKRISQLEQRREMLYQQFFQK